MGRTRTPVEEGRQLVTVSVRIEKRVAEQMGRAAKRRGFRTVADFHRAMLAQEVMATR